VTWAFSGAGMEMMRGCPPSTGISRTNLNLTHMVPIFGAFRKVLSVLVADRLQAGPKRHSIESETIGRGACARRKATYKQDCHSLRPMTAPSQNRKCLRRRGTSVLPPTADGVRRPLRTVSCPMQPSTHGRRLVTFVDSGRHMDRGRIPSLGQRGH
jgi:hypothetical protein